MWLKCSLCSKNCSFPYSWLFSLSFRQLELFSISLEGSSYWKSTVILIITWKLLFFFNWICVIIWNICFWSVVSSMYWKLRIGNCFYCNPTLAVLLTYTSDQNHKTMFFFSPVREMICPIKSHSWVSCQNSLWHWHTCFCIINPTHLLHQLVQFLTRQQFMHKYCRCTLSIKFTIFVTSFSSNITISSIKDLILL